MTAHITNRILSSLDWWTDHGNICKGVAFAPPQQSLTLVMDASELVWRDHLSLLHTQCLRSSQDLSAYKCQGVGTYPVILHSVTSTHQREGRVGSDQQYNGQVLCKQIRRSSIFTAVSDSSSILGLLHCQFYTPECGLLSRDPQYNGRLPKQVVDQSSQVVPSPEHSKVHFPALGNSPSGSICNRSQQKMSPVLLLSGPQPGFVDWHFFTAVVKWTPVRFSSLFLFCLKFCAKSSRIWLILYSLP